LGLSARGYSECAPLWAEDSAASRHPVADRATARAGAPVGGAVGALRVGGGGQEEPEVLAPGRPKARAHRVERLVAGRRKAERIRGISFKVIAWKHLTLSDYGG